MIKRQQVVKGNMAARKAKQRKERRRTARATVRIAPFAVKAKSVNGGFTLEFTGLTIHRQKLEVELEFPLWFMVEIAGALASVVQGKRAEFAKILSALRGAG